MSTISIAICDDDQQFADYEKKQLQSVLAEMCIDYEIDVFNNPLNFEKELVKQNTFYHIILLDIDMKEKNGLEIAKTIYEQFNGECNLIFVTSYDKYVFQSFKYQPLRYIKKEAYIKDIKEAVSVAIQRLELFDNDMYYMCNTIDGIFKIQISNIMYFERDGKNIKIVMKNNVTYVTSKESIKSLMFKFQKYNFVMIHNGGAVNLHYVTGYEAQNIVVNESIHLYLSRRKKNEFKDSY